MTASTIDGRQVAEARRTALAERVRALAGRGIAPCLAAVTVRPDAGWSVYVRNQANACAAAGIAHRSVELPPGSSAAELGELIEALNLDPAVHGIILQSPFPQDLDAQAATAQLSPAKDVEGVGPANLGLVLAGRPALAPCTAVAAVDLARTALGDLGGVEAVVVGASTVVGKPIAQLLLAAGATVTVCHILTRDLAAHTRRADLLFVAAGKAGLITGAHLKPGATVIDVGINRVAGPDGKSRIVGDVAPDAWEIAGRITPVPGGVGALTTTILLEATAAAAERLHGARAGLDGAALGRVLAQAGVDVEPRLADRLAGLLGSHLAAVPVNLEVRSALERRLARGVTVFDGAMGSELIARGVAPARTALANVEHPDLVLAVHRAYREAGAEVATANTFLANRFRCGDRAAAIRLMAEGVRLARQAAAGGQFVLASIGPLGPVVGAELALADAEEAFAELGLAARDAGADAILVETMSSTGECVAALAGLKRSARLPVLVSRSLARDDASEIGEFAAACEAGGAAAIGVNCAVGPRALVPVVARLAAQTRLPVFARPNAGFPARDPDGRLRYHLRGEWLVAQAKAYVAAGANAVGGCCGIGPEHIRALATALKGTALAPRPASSPTPPAAPLAPPAAPPFLAALRAGAFPVLGLVPARLPDPGAALARMSGAGAAAVGLLAGWPGADRGVRQAVRLRQAADRAGAPAVLELIAGELTLAQAQEQLIAAHLLGITLVLIDAGVFSSFSRADAPAGGDPAALLAFIQRLNAGRDLDGSRLESPTRFAAGIRLRATEAERLPGWAAAGAAFACLQPVYDPATFRAAMAALADAPVPILAEVLLLPDRATADELDNEIPALAVPERLKERLGRDPDSDLAGVERFLAHWRGRLAGLSVLLPDARTAQAERLIAAVRKDR